MSQSAPWNYGGSPQSQGTGAVKMFNPAEFNAAGNVPTSKYGNVTQVNSSASGATNGHEQNQGGQWDFNPSQWNSYDAQGQVGYLDQGQDAKGQIQVEGQGQNSGGQGQISGVNADNTGAFQGQQYYNPQQQYYNQQQYWNHVDPSQPQEWQNQLNWQSQQQMPTYVGQNWGNPGDNSGQYQGGQGQTLPVGGYQQQNFNHYSNEIQGQGQVQGQGHINDNVDPLDSSLTSTEASESLNQSMNDHEQGTVSRFFGSDGVGDYNPTGQGEVLQSQQIDNNVNNFQHSIEPNIQDDVRHKPAGDLGVVEGVTSQFRNIYIEEKSVVPQQGFSTESTQDSLLNNQNQTADTGQGSSVENVSDTNQAPLSEDQQGLSDWEVVPPQTLGVPPSSHSRQGSADNNVQFFIGSSRNSPSVGTGSSASSVHGHGGGPDDGTQTATSSDPLQESSVAAEIKEQAAFLTEPVVPKHTSSPNVSTRQLDTSGSEVPAPAPPVGIGNKGDNPFRKGGTKPGSQTVPLASIPDESKLILHGQGNVSLFDPSSTMHQQSVTSMFSGNDNIIEPPSPIPSSEDMSRPHSSTHSTPKPQPQSPIMPRKESPFQPPARRRNTSGSSETIEENSKLENLEEMASRKHDNRDSEKYGKSSVELSSRRSSGSDSFEKSEKDAVYSKETGRRLHTRSQRDHERYRRSKPPPGPSSGSRGIMSPRRMEKVLQQSQAQRAKHNMSPATTLWADSDVLSSSNIILAPAAPMPAVVAPVSGKSSSLTVEQNKTGSRDTHGVLTPVENLITTMTEHISKESTPELDTGNTGKPTSSDIKRAEPEVKKDTSFRDKHERNSSIDRELEICRKQEEAEKRKDNTRYDERGNELRHRGEHYSQRDQYRDSRGYERESRDRADIARDPRSEEYDAYYRQPKGKDGYSRGGPPPPRDPYRDQYYGDERYERPRSRTSAYDEEQQRSSSRQGQERPRSRQEYSRDPYYRDKYGRSGYDYDYYGRQDYYYDHRYYDQGRGYYGDNRYAKAYVDEYYQGQYNEQFNRLLDFSNYYGYPVDRYGQGYEEDRYSQRSQSRVQTPGSLSDVGEQPDQYGYGSRSSSRVGYDEYQRAQYDYYYNRGNYQDPYAYHQQQDATPGRMTPAKYHIPHMKACFGPGGELVKVLPNRPTDGQPATVEIHELNELLQENPETEELRAFLGPLIRGDTHKNDVLTFCQRKARYCAEKISMTDRESAELLWKLLELLIKQNGNVVGTDIADLLLEGHEPTTVDYSMMGMRICQSRENILDEELDSTADISNVTADRSIIPQSQAREEVTDRFRHLLLYGRKKDALDWAMKKNLWGHALFLASKMDNRTHANVMTRFANVAMKINDPLQTLYQLMSGRQPASVTSIADERWGDWRPHLAMILSNHSNKPDLDRKSIMSLGDTLASKGFLHASQFCYLMAQVSFGSYHKKTSKLVLIGSNHSLPLSEFATNEAIQCTEIYEYAMSLGSAAYFLINFQYFKFLYACRLAENGFPQEALHYCDVISRYIQRSPTMFQPTLVRLVYNLADRLKHFDPQRLHMGEDAEDPFWLQQLKRITQGFEDGTIRPISGSVTPMTFGGMTRSSSESGEVANYTQAGATDFNNTANQSQLMYGQDSYYQHQQGYGHPTDQSQVMSDQSLVQQETGSHSGQQVVGQEQYGVQQSAHSYSQQQDNNYGLQQGNILAEQQGNTYSQQQTTGAQQEQHGAGQPSAGYNYSQYGVPQQETQAQESSNQNLQSYTANQNLQSHTANQNQGYPVAADYQYSNYVAQESNTSQIQTHSHDYSNFGTQLPQRQESTAESDSEEETDGDLESSLGGSHTSAGGGGFDYFTAATQRTIVAPKLRKRTASETSNTSGSGSRQRQESGSKSAMPPPKPPAKKSEDKAQGKGLFGGLFSKFMPKPKNEIKLPNDTNPSIVWDDVKKKWVNTDEPEEDEAPPAPPPKDSDVLGGSKPAKPLSSASELPPGGAPSMPPMGNKYTKPKGRGAQARYVDVMNPKPSATNVPNSLFNVMPTVQSAPAIFNPGGKTEDTAEPVQSSELNSQNAKEENPLPPGGGDQVQTGEMSRTSSMSSVSYEVQQLTQKVKQEPTQDAGPPMMFNPAQFSGQQSTNTSVPATGGPRRYGQRRVYPK